MSWASLNGEPVTSGVVTIPYFGLWSADVVLSAEDVIADACRLVLGDLTLVGHLVRSAPFGGSRSCRLVGGAGGWRKSVTQQAYRKTGGVMLSTVLGDAAIAVGETIKIGTDRSLGTAWVREAGPASRLLRLVAPDLWWIDAAGVTQLGARVATPIKSDFQVIAYSGGKGKLTIATETLADWTPGRTFTSPTVPTSVRVASVSHVIAAGSSRMEVLAA